MHYQQLTLQSVREKVDDITDVLHELGALAITLKDAEDQPIFAPGVGEFELWDQVLISALFAEETDMQTIITTLNPAQYKLEEVPDQDWEHTWKEDFHRQCYNDKLWIYPTWDTPETLAKHSLILDPGLAFGTGKHATTNLCLQWLAEIINQQDLVIDYGCGSGILALAALELGAKKAIAIDNDPQAIESTQQNAAQNQLSIETYFPEQTPASQADILIANILANPLIELAPTFAKLVKPDGLIALSGILIDQVEMISETYAPWFKFEQPRYNEDWALLVGKKTQPSSIVSSITEQEARTLPLRKLITCALETYFEQLDGMDPANLYDMVLEEVEVPLLKKVLTITGGNQSKAAALLGISRGTLRKKLQQYQLEK